MTESSVSIISLFLYNVSIISSSRKFSWIYKCFGLHTFLKWIMLANQSFTTLYSQLMLIIHLKVISVKGIRSVCSLFLLFFTCRCSVVPLVLIEKIFLHCIVFVIFEIFLWFSFWVPYSVSLFNLSILLTIPFCLHFFGFIVSLT